jgi:hypothetical protein
MIALICFVLAVLASPFKSKSRLEAENAALRHQLIVLRRKMPGRPWLTNNDRWFFLQMYRWFPSILKVVRFIQPETLVRWHRAGFRCYWRWKSLGRGGRPQIETELRALIRRMSIENPLWVAPRIHGELLKLGLAVAQSSVAKYMVKRRWPPSQGWCTFLRNHAPDSKTVCPSPGLRWLVLLCASEGCSGGPSRSSSQEDEPWVILQRFLSGSTLPKHATRLRSPMASVAARSVISERLMPPRRACAAW